MQNSLKTIIATAVIICGFWCFNVWNKQREQKKPPLPEGYADSDLTLQGAKMKGFAFGAEGLLADWYWMQSLQYLGGKVSESKENLNLEDLSTLNPRLLYPYLDNATDLDPRFMAVFENSSGVFAADDGNKTNKIF